MWQGDYITAVRAGRWEYVERAGRVTAVVILAEHDGKVLLVEQPRVPLGRRCLELPAGLVGDTQAQDSVEQAARRELEEETGFAAERIEVIGDFYSSPGMVAESFTLVRAHGVRKVGEGGAGAPPQVLLHPLPSILHPRVPPGQRGYNHRP